MKRFQLLFAILPVFFLCSQTQLSAQNKLFTELDAAGANYKLYPTSLSQLQWISNTDQFSWTEGKFIFGSGAQQPATDTLLSLEDLNSWMIEAGTDSIKRMPSLQWTKATTALFQFKHDFYTLDLYNKKVQLFASLPEEAENIQLSGKKSKIAYTIDNNLFVFDGNKHVQISNEPEGVQCGKSVHRNEFGINGGIFWSPDEKKLAYYRMDERMVSNYPLVDVSNRIATLKNERYPMAGMTSHEVSLLVFDLETQANTKVITEGPSDQYLTSVTWHPESKSIFVGLLNRGQNHLQMMHYDATNGTKINMLFEEHDDHYVEPMHPLHFVPGNNNQFIWLSDRNGFRHCYLYDTAGKLIKQLTDGEWEVISLSGIDPKGEQVFITATKESPLEQNTYAVQLKNSKIKRLTSQKGVHRSQMSNSGRYLLDTYSNRETARETWIIDTKAKNDRLLHKAENPLAAYTLGAMEIFTLQANDGTPLYCRLIKPMNFDPEKKYPAIIYVYGGPHAQMITESWMGGASFYLNYLAQKGYVVFTLDNRGSAKRGKSFEQIIHRKLGQIESEDQMQGVAYLKSLPWVDADRIGVDGWSYGGFMSINLKLNHPETFKVAVAGGPVIDWQLYEVMYGERYMDTPEENPDGYHAANLLNQVDKLEGKLLVIHGDMDPVVVWQHSLQFLKACIKAGKLVDYFVYPGYEHNVRGRDRSHLIKKITTYFDENL